MRAATCLLALVWVLASASPAVAEPELRRIAFWPDAVPRAIWDHVDGNDVLDTVRALGAFHRVQGSPGYRAAADWLVGELVRGGFADAAVEALPADGTTRYAHFPSYFGWQASEGRLDEIAPVRRTLADFAHAAVALADYSQDGDVTAELVDVGAGDRDVVYEGKDVRGKIVLADGALPAVHRLAVEQRGAAGIVSDYPNQRTAWSGQDPDLVRWGHLSPYQTSNRFAFMISPRIARGLRDELARGAVRLTAHVRAKLVPASFDVVSTTIAGSDPAAGAIVLTAHLCHERAGANDNASGSAAILEVGRALTAAIRRGTLPPPKRTIRFLWLPEISGSQVYLVRHPELVSRIVAGVHMDMVGGLISTTKGTFHLSRTAESLPHVVNPIAAAWFAQVQAASLRYAEGRGDAYAGFVWPPGSRESFVGDVRGIEMGSDHEVFEAAGFRVPMVYFHDYPDVTIHTQKDLPENLDATKLGRVAYMGAGIAWTLAALPDSEAKALLAVTRAEVEQHVLARGAAPGPDPALAAREAIAQGVETLESLGRLSPSIAPDVSADVEHLRAAMPPAPPTSDRRVPVRAATIVGPLNVYYYDYFADLPAPGTGADFTKSALASREDGEVLAYEALNLADGKRSVSEIRDALTGRYSTVPVSAVAEYFELLARAGAVSFR